MNNREYKREWQRRWRKEHPQASLNSNRKAALNRKKRFLLLPKAQQKIEQRKKIGSVLQWQKKYPERFNAHQVVYRAVKSGKLVRGICWCGETKVQAHHEDYSKPLEVVWLCRQHHEVADKLRQMTEKINAK